MLSSIRIVSPIEPLLRTSAAGSASRDVMPEILDGGKSVWNVPPASKNHINFARASKTAIIKDHKIP